MYFGQQLKFNGELVDTVFIKSHRSVYQFDEKGTTKGDANILSISYNYIENKYLIDKYYQDEYSRTFRPDTISINKKDLLRKVELKINNENLKNLLSSLTKNKKTKSLIEQIDTIAFKEYVYKKEIRSTARRFKTNWNFKRRYSTKKENNAFFKSCQSIDSLKLYLKERFDTKGYVIITDYSNTFNIWISTTSNEYRFEGKYPNPVKQPWYNHNVNSQGLTTLILNLDINKNLEKVLPDKFLLIDSISEKSLFNDYIIWYLERRHMTD